MLPSFKESMWRKCLQSIFMSMWHSSLMRINLLKPTARSMSAAAGSIGLCGGAGKRRAARLGLAVVTGNAGRRVEAMELSSVTGGKG